MTVTAKQQVLGYSETPRTHFRILRIQTSSQDSAGEPQVVRFTLGGLSSDQLVVTGSTIIATIFDDETREILADRDTVARLVKAGDDIRTGRTISGEKVRSRKR